MNLLTVTDVARRLAVSKSLVYVLVASGELPYVPVGKSKAYRFDPDDITAYIHRRKVQNEGRKSIVPLSIIFAQLEAERSRGMTSSC